MAIFDTPGEILRHHSIQLKQGREPDGSPFVRWVDITNIFAPGLYRTLRQAIVIWPLLILPVAYVFAVYLSMGWQALIGMIAAWVGLFVFARKIQKDARLIEYPRHLIFRPDGRIEVAAPFQWMPAGADASADLGSWKNIVSVEFGDGTHPDTPPPPDHRKRFALPTPVDCVALFYANGAKRVVSESFAGRDSARMVTIALTSALADARRAFP